MTWRMESPREVLFWWVMERLSRRHWRFRTFMNSPFDKAIGCLDSVDWMTVCWWDSTENPEDTRASRVFRSLLSHALSRSVETTNSLSFWSKWKIWNCNDQSSRFITHISMVFKVRTTIEITLLILHSDRWFAVPNASVHPIARFLPFVLRCCSLLFHRLEFWISPSLTLVELLRSWCCLSCSSSLSPPSIRSGRFSECVVLAGLHAPFGRSVQGVDVIVISTSKSTVKSCTCDLQCRKLGQLSWRFWSRRFKTVICR
jgi:hypothetical protein